MILEDGFASIIEMADFPNILIFEIDVTPVGVEGGDPIPQTHMRDTIWHTDAPQRLMRLTQSSVTYAYDNAAWPDILTAINHRQLLTQVWPDLAFVDYWGWMRNAIPGTLSIGGRPTFTAILCPSNINASGQRVAPLWGQG